VVLVDLTLCRQWAAVIDTADKTGMPMGVADAWIAATALTMTCPLITHNAGDFQGAAGLTIITQPGP
jgi:predicted nucleic acid-binding protein